MTPPTLEMEAVEKRKREARERAHAHDRCLPFERNARNVAADSLALCADIDALQAEVERLQLDRRDMRALLQSVEWTGDRRCPSCEGQGSHDLNGCKLDTAIRALEAP